MADPSPILIVDDNAATRYSVRRVLEHHGYRVDEAGNGADGLDLLAKTDYAALVLDVNLPDMSGFDVVRRLRQDARTHLLPVIHVSAASIATGDMITGLDAGADAYLIHPVDHDVLLATLRTLLRVRRAEDALRASEATFREIFENIAAPIAVVDSNLRALESNEAFQSLFGAAAQQDGLEPRISEQAENVAALRASLAKRERWRGTFSLREGAATRITEWRVSPYREPDLGLLFIEDVTAHHAREHAHQQELQSATTQLAYQIAERQRTEAELMQAQKMDSLGKLTGGIAHDFNNLLTSIMSGLDMISMAVEVGKLDRVPRYIDIATSSATRAAGLTQRMLAFARKQSLAPQSFDIAARLRSLEDMLRRSIGENIDLILDIEEGPLVAVADPNQFENVIINLVINARDALPSGGFIRIVGRDVQLATDHELAGGNYASVSVIDNGTGIPADVIDKVFEPFFTTKPQGEGTGLGLSMTYGFARQSHGTVRIDSETGRGTAITLMLPRGDVAEPEQQVRHGHPPKGTERLLLVDDTDVVRMMVREVLVEAGYEVADAANAQDALRALQSNAPFDLLISDVGLPGMNGRELADAVREMHPDMPVLFITGYTENAAVRQTFLGDGMSLLMKPFSLHELLGNVRQMLA